MNAVAKVKTNDHTQEFKQALTRLTLRNDAIFFIAMLYSMRHERYDPLVIRGQRAPAATDSVRICYDGEAFGAYSLDDRQFILVHEILHVILYHPLRRGIREPNLWNIACDYVVNGMVADGGDFKVPKDGIQPDPAFKGLSAERVYDLLQKEAQEALSGGKTEGKGKSGRTWVRGDPEAGDGQGDTQLEGGPGQNPKDVQDYNAEANEGKPASQVEREIGVNTEKALQAAKAAGQGSHLMKQFLQEAQVAHEPWYAHLRRYMTVLNERQYNWARINARRAVLHNVVSPDMKTEAMGDIVLSIDESGSQTNEQLAAIGAHCAQLMRECHPKRVIVIRHTDRVTDVEVFEGPDYTDFNLVRKSTGGTDFNPVFDHVEANFPEAQVLLMFTDMYGPFPQGFSIDTMWVTSTEESAIKTPFGERIRADFND
jgi:predicted metal-dependent peptidase